MRRRDEPVSEYEKFKEASPENLRLLRQEALILEVSEALAEALEEENVTRAELARRLGKTRGFVSQILSGGRNLTLRTLADVCLAIGREPQVGIVSEAKQRMTELADRQRRIGEAVGLVFSCFRTESQPRLEWASGAAAGTRFDVAAFSHPSNFYLPDRRDDQNEEYIQ